MEAVTAMYGGTRLGRQPDRPDAMVRSMTELFKWERALWIGML
jgi:phage terminase large subunit-like protein